LRKNIAFTFYLALFVMAAATLLSAQEPPPSAASSMQMTEAQVNDANLQLMRQDIRSERKKVVAANMPLTETEATKPWPVYDQYIAETSKVNDVRFALLKEYTTNYETSTDGQANSFIKRSLTLDQNNTHLRLKYIPEFEKVSRTRRQQYSFRSTAASA
jgi:hypothetical protein